MSVSTSQPDFDFWEFVTCEKCQLPFASGTTVPFWLTECGHTVCNNHLNADQSCAICSSPEIQLIPLQQEMDAPMSGWFKSVPCLLDSAAYAAKFQQESMASQIRWLKTRCQQQRSHIERLKREVADLRQCDTRQSLPHHLLKLSYRANELLTARESAYGSQEPSGFVNSNGKRPLADLTYLPPPTSSSPHLALGANRLTIPAGQQPPQLSSNQIRDEQPYSFEDRSRELPLSQQRPGSSKFAQKYTFIPSSKPQMRPPTQQASYRQSARNTQFQEKPVQQEMNSRTMPPPARLPDNKQLPRDRSRNIPLPQPSRSDTFTSKYQTQNFVLSTPVSHRFRPSGPMSNGKHFVPAAPIHPSEKLGVDRASTARGSTAVDSRAPPRSFHPNLGGSGQRRPFVPR
ncbi:hypothetical protein K435DRAFT_348012 [Dendrothele bispora CBS 962.96]|uniref:RING-type domain-containing protein n=1 Tax=Dendrothele bispora (strain CBS 962.96) TaxID=1314807 RepID=A0A4S8LFI7_DENBC|nr:hypothetical protein K435DRAFT_348012 [Dendrothele bispora CBS 962.96]